MHPAEHCRAPAGQVNNGAMKPRQTASDLLAWRPGVHLATASSTATPRQILGLQAHTASPNRWRQPGRWDRATAREACQLPRRKPRSTILQERLCVCTNFRLHHGNVKRRRRASNLRSGRRWRAAPRTDPTRRSLESQEQQPSLTTRSKSAPPSILLSYFRVAVSSFA